MQQNERKSSGINIGSASIIMVFSVLCLTIFAVLTFVTANNEFKLAEKSSNAIKTYYEADTRAVMTEGKIKEALARGAQVEIDGVTVTVEDDGYHFKYAETVDENQELQVELCYNGLRSDMPNALETIKWELKNVAEWSPDAEIQLWDGVN